MPDSPRPVSDDPLAAGAVALGLLSLLTCWWFPFGVAVGAAGAACGGAAWMGGRDRRLALVGMGIAGVGAMTGLLLASENGLLAS